MKNNKYYTPNIEEFHVGFECEAEYSNNTFIPVIMQGVGQDVIKYHKQGIYRVKHLNIEDVESLNFYKTVVNTWAGWEDYVIQDVNPKQEYYLKATLHIPKMGDLYEICVHRYWTEENSIENLIKSGESKIVFIGTINNKSELVKTLKKLVIL
jgi:hypothetical protein